MPDAYIDLGRMLGEPKDIVIDVGSFSAQSTPDPATIEDCCAACWATATRPG